MRTSGQVAGAGKPCVCKFTHATCAGDLPWGPKGQLWPPKYLLCATGHEGLAQFSAPSTITPTSSTLGGEQGGLGVSHLLGGMLSVTVGFASCTERLHQHLVQVFSFQKKTPGAFYGSSRTGSGRSVF